MIVKFLNTFFILAQSSILLGCIFLTPSKAMPNPADEEEAQLKSIKKSLCDYYTKNDFVTHQKVALIKKDFTITYLHHVVICNSKDYWKDGRSVLHRYAKEKKESLIGVAGIVFYKNNLLAIELFSDLLCEYSIKPFCNLCIPSCKNSILQKTDFLSITPENIYNVHVGEFIISHTMALYTEKLRDCVGIVAREIENSKIENSEKISLIHYHRGQHINVILKDLKGDFSPQKSEIYLISEYYTPHLLALRNALTNAHYHIKEWDITKTYLQFLTETFVIGINSLSSDLQKSFEKAVLVIPGKDTILVSHKKLVFPKY